MTEQGHVLAVTLERLGDELATAASLGATSITVKDIADFDELGGTLTINGLIYGYTSADDDTNVIELAGTLAAGAAAGDDVFIWDLNYAAVVTDLVAQVQVDGDIDGDPHECSVEYQLVKDLVGGIRGLIGEAVLIEEEDDDWRVIDVLGLGNPDASGTQFRNTDTLTVTATGTQTFTLTQEPIAGSEHLRWHPGGGAGLDLLTSEWSRSGKVVTIPSPAGVKVGDVYDAAYAYRVGINSPAIVSFESSSDGAGSQPTMPAGAQAGDLLIAIVSYDSTNSVTPSGWTLIGATSNVTHSIASGAGSRTYKMAVYSLIHPGGTPSMLSFASVALPQPIWLVTAARGSSSVSASAFATVADDGTCAAPALPGYDGFVVRGWTAIMGISGGSVSAPTVGTTLVHSGGTDVDSRISYDNETAVVSASTAGRTSGWMAVSIGVS